MRYFFLIVAVLVIGWTTWLSAPIFGYPLGSSQATISDLYHTPITPAGFTFSIWSIIYLSWIVMGVLIAMRKIQIKKSELLGWSLSMILTAIWLVPWGLQMITTSLIVMILLFVTLTRLYQKLRKKSGLETYSTELFLGWIHIATFANLSAWIVSIGIQIPTHIFSLLIISIATGATLFYQMRYRSYIITFVFLWAMLGIFYGQSDELTQLWTIMGSSILILTALSSWLTQKK